MTNELLDFTYSAAYNASNLDSSMQSCLLEIDIPKIRHLDNNYDINTRIPMNLED